MRVMMAMAAARVMDFSFVISCDGYKHVPVSVPVSITSLMIFLSRTCVNFIPVGMRHESYKSDLLKYGGLTIILIYYQHNMSCI